MLNRIKLKSPAIFLGTFLAAGAMAWGAEGGIGEVSGFGGLVSIRQGGSNHGQFGGTVGANAGRFVHLFGEVNYMSLGSDTFQSAGNLATGSDRLTNYSGGIQIRIPTGQAKVEPYGLLAFGYGRRTVDSSVYANNTFTSNRVTEGDLYTGVGAGARVFLGRKWGIKPEFRYQSYVNMDLKRDNPIIERGSVMTLTGGIFFQFGGTTK